MSSSSKKSREARKRPSPSDVTGRPDTPGEGNREAGQRYVEATRKFIEEGKVADAAERAKNMSPEELEESRRAEEEGRSHRKG